MIIPASPLPIAIPNHTPISPYPIVIPSRYVNGSASTISLRIVNIRLVVPFPSAWYVLPEHIPNGVSTNVSDSICSADIMSPLRNPVPPLYVNIIAIYDANIANSIVIMSPIIDPNFIP